MMKYVIETPNKRYSGVTEGVAFSGGRAIVEDENIKNILVNDYGYSVAEEIFDDKNEDKSAAKKSAKKSDK